MIEDATDRLEYLEEWGTTATVGAVPGIPCIFRDRPAQAMGLDGSVPTVWGRTEDLVAAAYHTPVTVDGRNWRVAADPRDDREGMTTLELELLP